MNDMRIEDWIGVDLDGTLAEYHGWKGEGHIGKPIKPMVERVKEWLAQGKRVKIFTARVDNGSHQVDVIKAWCSHYIGQALEVTNVKDIFMVELWDDRAVCVKRNDGAILGRNEEVIYEVFDNLSEEGKATILKRLLNRRFGVGYGD